jgi:hypothetical protein
MPLADDQKLRVAVNNYRYGGGDNYTVYKGLPIVYRSSEEIRDIIIEHLTRTHVIPTTTDQTWRIEPQEAVESLRRAALEQEQRATSPAIGATGAFLVKPEQNFGAPAGN